MKKLIIILALGAMASLQAGAQSKTIISYSIGFPTGDVGDFISPVSFRGVSLDYHKMVNDNLGLGFTLALNVFYEELAKDTYTVDNQSLTGKQFRYSNHVPVLFSAAYYLKDFTVAPFVSLGIGTIYSRRNVDMGQFTLKREAWNFALAPEIGIEYSMFNGHQILLSAQYFNGFKAGNELDESQTYFALKIGYGL